jgi:hypothetical protein
MCVIGSVGSLTPTHLNEYFSHRDEGCAELCEEQAADKEVTLVLPEELRRETHTVSKQNPATRYEQRHPPGRVLMSQ